MAEYCRILRGRFPQIDYLFCGFGGASYFPNCIRVPGKDDVAVARARETFFLENFALIADWLRPKLALPFAAHFVLPDDDNWWISATRLAMEAPSDTVRRLLPSSPVAFADLAPGDAVEDGRVHTTRGDERTRTANASDARREATEGARAAASSPAIRTRERLRPVAARPSTSWSLTCARA